MNTKNPVHPLNQRTTRNSKTFQKKKTRNSKNQHKKKEIKERVTSSPNSKSFVYILSPTERKCTALFQIQDLDDPIFRQECVPSGSHAQPHGPRADGVVAQIELAPDGSGEVAVPIGQQEHLVVDIEVLLPGFHDEGVVDRNANDGVDPFGLELLGLDDEAQEVLLGAGGGEGAGDGQEDGLLLFLVRSEMVVVWSSPAGLRKWCC